MNIGDKVTVILQMDVEGLKRDPFSSEILIEGKMLADKGHFFITVPQRVCSVIGAVHVV